MPPTNKEEVVSSPNVRGKNKRGEWVPVIEEPYEHIFRKECRCGQKFWTRYGYEAHYALIHILNY